ncbi:MAG: peptide ABC transporter substrate-binding protein, partial [Rhodospirillales bacterium]
RHMALAWSRQNGGTTLRFLDAFSAILVAMMVSFAMPAVAKDRLVIGITQFPANFHPAIESMLAKTLITSMARRPVTAYDPDWKLICLLCTDLPTLENGLAERVTTAEGKPGIRVTYTLKSGLVWGDGTALTSADVAFTWNLGKHPQSGFGGAELYRRILAVDVLDDRRFTLTFDRVSHDYNDISGFDILPRHLEEPATKDMARYRENNAYDRDPTAPGLWFGPYRVAEVVTGVSVTLERNPVWTGKKPAFDSIVFKAIENTAALEANLLSGNLDMIAGELGLSIDQAVAFEKRHGEKFKVTYRPGLIYEHIDLNLDDPVLSDPRVRQGLLLALDRDVLSARLFGGRQPVADSNVNPLDANHWTGTPRYAHDPARAAALFDEAGFSEVKDGIRHDKDGRPLRFELMSTAGNRIREVVEQVLQSQWRQVGVAVDIRNEPPRVFFGETVTKRAFPHMAMFAWISAPDSVPRTTLHSAHIPAAESNWAGQNYTGYKSAEMDALIDAAEVELDAAKRQDLWAKMQALYARDLPALPLYFRAEPHVWPRQLTGIRPTGHQYVSSLWVEDWGWDDSAR